MPIPGANTRLGQGSPGGAAGLPGGLPLPGGGLTGPPAGSIPGIPGLPSVATAVGPRPTAQVAPLPIKTRTGTANAAAEVGTGLSSILHQQNLKENPGSTKSIQDAYRILLDVESGHVSPEQAAKLMQGLTLGDQGKLQDLIGSHFAQTGTSDRNVLKALQKLQTLPAPADVEPHDLLTNFARDANEAVTGLPAGLGLAAVYGTKDLLNTMPGRKGTSNFYDKILKPIGGQYAHQYGPALHGDFGKAYERFHEHPLGPALDLISLVSAGAGTAGRVARAGEAIDAARAGTLADAARVTRPLDPAIHGSGKVVVDHSGLENSIQRNLEELGVGNDPQVRQFIGDKIGKDYHQHTRDLVRDLKKADVPITIRPTIDYHEGFDSLINPVDKANPVYRVQVGNNPEATFSVGIGADGKRWVDDIHQFGDHDAFFESGDAVARKLAHDQYFKAVEHAYDKIGPDTSDRITLYRSMDPKEYEAWKKGEPVPPGKFFADHPDYASGVDETGKFPTRYKIIANKHDVVQTAPHIFQLKNEAKFDEKGLLTSGAGEVSRNLRPVLGDTAADLPEAQRRLDAQTGIPRQFFKRPTPQEIREEPYLNHFSVFYNTKSGRTLFGPTGSSHDEILESDKLIEQAFKDGLNITTGEHPKPGTFSDQLYHAREAKTPSDKTGHWMGATGVFDPETGRPAAVNFSSDHPDAAKWEQDVLEKATKKYWEAPPPESSMPLAMDAMKGLETGGDHSIEPTTGLSKVQLVKAGIRGFTQGGPKGNLIERYEGVRGITHEAEIQNYMKEIAAVLDNSNLRIGRRGLSQVVKDVASDIRATRAAGKARPTEMAANLPGFIAPGSSGRALSAAETSLREASDLVRAGAIYLRPAYLPNNWAGNTFMNAVHQGAWAPLNLAKSLVISKHMDPENLAALRKSMGTNPAEAVTTGTGRGYVASITQPVAHVMGAIADQPFRDSAFLHEARRAGYRTLKSVDDLFNVARRHETSAEGVKALREIANISRKAQEEIVKFGHMNEAERSVIRNLVFVYSWMRGAGRYAARFPFAHPIQTNAFQKLSGPGNSYVSSVMGGMPSFLQGSVPVGRDKNGNPILVNPFSLNPLGTGLQLGRAAAGTLDVIRNPKDFNKFAQTDVTSLLNPILGSYLTAREGGQPMKKGLENTIAILALKKGLEHPGAGNIYPTSRGEALGHFGIGSLFPRVADQAAISKALARENVGDPAAMIPQQLKDFKKATGADIPPELVSGYRGDLEAMQIMKDFQSSYAEKHGASGFRNMAPANKVDAALSFLTQYGHLPPKDLNQLKAAVSDLTTDAELNAYANELWRMTGVGEYKNAWDKMMRTTKGQQLTRKK